MRIYSAVRKSLILATAVAAALSAAACSGSGTTGASPTSAVPAPIQPAAQQKQFVFSISSPSLVYFHATSPAQTDTIVVADRRSIAVSVEDPTVATATIALGPTLPNG